MASPFAIPAPGAAPTATPPRWTASEILKIRLEGADFPGDYIGFVDINPDETSLADVRALVARDVEGVPRHGYHFLFADGVPISRRQEASQLAMQLLPAVTIRPCDGGGVRPDEGAAVKVMIQFKNEQHAVWMPTGYTFAQLVVDAARFWKLKPSDVVLEDGDGCAWPESAQVRSMVSFPLPSGKPFLVHLMLKDVASRQQRFSSSDSLEEDAQSLVTGGDTKEDVPSSSKVPSNAATAGANASTLPNQSAPPPPPGESESKGSSTRTESEASTSPKSSSLSSSDVESELWNIFSYYCVHGDAKEVQHLRCHHWLQFMRDIGLLGPQLGNSTSCALFRVIYSAETRGSVGSSGKMNYNEFLDGLMNVAARACHQCEKEGATINDGRSRLADGMTSPTIVNSVDASALDTYFVDLLATYILPRAKRWNTRAWHQHTTLVRSPDVVHVVRPFIKSLYEIFRFYAPDPHSQADGTASVLHLYLDYTGFKKHLGEMFLAACNAQDGSFLSKLGGHPVDNSQKQRASALNTWITTNEQKNSSEAMTSRISTLSTNYQSMNRSANLSVHRTYSRQLTNVDNEGADAHSPDAHISRDRMYFEGFVDVLVRSALVGLRPMGGQAEAACAAAEAPKLTHENGSVSQLLPPSPRRADQLRGESKMRMKQSELDVAVTGSHQSAPDSAVTDNIQTRDRSLSGSLTPRTMTPHVWGGSGDTRSPSFRPNLLISKQQGGRSGGIKNGSYMTNQRSRHPSSAPKSLSSLSSSSAPSSFSFVQDSGISNSRNSGAVLRPAFSYQKLTRAAVNSNDASGLRSSKRSKSPSSNSNNSNSPGANEVPGASSPESGKSDKSATFGGSPLLGPSASGEELSKSMPALNATRSNDGDSPESNQLSTKDTSEKTTSSSPAQSKSGTAKNASERAISNVELLRMQEDIKLDKQLRALELHEREAKEEETRLELLRQKKEIARRQKVEEEEQRQRNYLIRKRLTRGHLFYKHGRNRRAERRFVYVTPQLDAIAWRSVTSKSDSKPSKVFQVSDLVRITAGLNDGKTKPVQSNNYCLTLHLHSRTIQLECDNEILRNAWIEAFRWLKISQLGMEIGEMSDS
eukprot:g4480.t1